MRVRRIIEQALGKTLRGLMHGRRWEALAFCVCALIRGGRLSVTGLGRSGLGEAKMKHTIKRVDRLVGNRHLRREHHTIARTLATSVLTNLERPVILIDWSVLPRRKLYCLSAAVPFGGRAVPIYSEVHPETKLANHRVQTRFLSCLRKVLPPSTRPVLVTDAGFRNPWFAEVAKLGWDYVGRLTARVRLQLPGDRRWQNVERFTVTGDLGLCRVAKNGPMPHRVVVVKTPREPRNPHRARAIIRSRKSAAKYRRRAKTPWVLVTSLSSPPVDRIAGLYRTRMQIEETFRDLKNHRWGWALDLCLSRHIDRWQNLLLIAAIATFVVTLIGMHAESIDAHHAFQANTVRARRVLSLFSLGRTIVAVQASAVPRLSELEVLLYPREFVRCDPRRQL